MTCGVIRLTLFESVKERVTAREAAEMYGMRFRGKRARCPWHADNHPDLAFYDNGTCFCHACHAGGDAVSLTAQIFGLTMIDAARKINADFGLGLDVEKPLSPTERKRIEQRRLNREREKEKDRREWSFLCDVLHEANRQIDAIVNAADRRDWDKVWDNPQFVRALQYRSRAENDLDRLYEMAVMRHG